MSPLDVPSAIALVYHSLHRGEHNVFRPQHLVNGERRHRPEESIPISVVDLRRRWRVHYRYPSFSFRPEHIAKNAVIPSGNADIRRQIPYDIERLVWVKRPGMRHSLWMSKQYPCIGQSVQPSVERLLDCAKEMPHPILQPCLQLELAHVNLPTCRAAAGRIQTFRQSFPLHMPKLCLPDDTATPSFHNKRLTEGQTRTTPTTPAEN